MTVTCRGSDEFIKSLGTQTAPIIRRGSGGGSLKLLSERRLTHQIVDQEATLARMARQAVKDGRLGARESDRGGLRRRLLHPLRSLRLRAKGDRLFERTDYGIGLRRLDRRGEINAAP